MYRKTRRECLVLVTADYFTLIIELDCIVNNLHRLNMITLEGSDDRTNSHVII